MIAYKLMRQKANGRLTPLFINKSKEIDFGKWLPAENHPTKGFKERKGWHCCLRPEAPHLSERGRIWVKVMINDFQFFHRPKHQGSTWILANEIKFLEVVQ